MMSIELAAYSDRATFEREIETLFSSRYFVGRVRDFTERDSYRSFMLGTRPITVRHTSAGIRAFSNVCLHRSKLIDPLGQGRRHFSCGYHGWTYGADGALTLAPMTALDCIQHQKLPTFSLQQVDDLLFLDTGAAIADVSKVSAAIAHTGLAFEAAFHRQTTAHHCNWKLLVDNVLETYHLNFVHRETFLKSGFTSTSKHAWLADEYVNLGSIEPLPSTSKLKAMQRLAPDAVHIYRHAFVFPNLFLASTNDLVGFVARVEPVSPSDTLLHWEVFELPLMLKLPTAVRENLREQTARFAAETLEEDRIMIESCQVGMTSRMGSLQLQPMEDRVASFHSYYREQMKHAGR